MITSTTTRRSYDGNGTTATFAVPFKFLADGDLVVVLHTALGYADATTYIPSGFPPTQTYIVGDIVRGVHPDHTDKIYRCTIAGNALASGSPLWLNTPTGTDAEITHDGTTLTWTFVAQDSGVEERTLATHYTVLGAGDAAGGSITFLTDFIPESYETVVIYNDPALTQEVDYVSGDSFPAESHETALDRVTLQQKRTREIAERALHLPDTAIDGDGAYDARRNRIKNLSAPTLVDDGATKTYVDTAVTNAAFSEPTGIVATGSSTPRDLADRWADTIHVKDFGAIGNGIVDDTDAIQAALTAAADTGGIVNFASASGQDYLITDNLVASGCTLRGGGNPSRVAVAEATLIRITGTANPAIKIREGTTVDGLTFFYPNQDTSVPVVVYPATIWFDHNVSTATSCNIINNTFINSYDAINTNTYPDTGSGQGHAGFSQIRYNRICAINKGIQIDYAPAEISIVGNEMSYGMWAASSVGDVRTHISSNGVAISLGSTVPTATLAGLLVSGNSIFGFNKAIEVASKWSVGVCSDNFFDGSLYGVDVVQGGSLARMVMIGNSFGSLDPNDATRKGACIRVRDGGAPGRSHYVYIRGNNFDSSQGNHIDLLQTVAGSTSRVIITGCVFHNAGWSDTAEPQSQEYSSILLDDSGTTHCSALITGNMFENNKAQAYSQTIGVNIEDCREVSVTNNQFRWMKQSIKVTRAEDLISQGNLSRDTVSGEVDQTLGTVTRVSISGNIWSSDSLGGSQVAGTATMALPISNPSEYILVTGSANITTITASWPGRVALLLFNGTAAAMGVVDGSNLKLSASLVYTPDDTLTLVCDGTNWYEVCRSGGASAVSSVQTLDAVAVPSVLNGTLFITSGSTMITGLADAAVGQTVTILADEAITIRENVGGPGAAPLSMVTVGESPDFDMEEGDTITFTCFSLITVSRWHETSRSVNTG